MYGRRLLPLCLRLKYSTKDANTTAVTAYDVVNPERHCQRMSAEKIVKQRQARRHLASEIKTRSYQQIVNADVIVVPSRRFCASITTTGLRFDAMAVEWASNRGRTAVVSSRNFHLVLPLNSM